MKIAVLDDYQGIARAMTDWGRLPPDCEVEFLQEHLFGEDACADRLAPFEAIVAMRERTPFRRSLLERLPNLRLLITTGARNASIDVAAAKERGIVVSGTNGQRTPTAELTWGLIIGLLRHIPEEDQRVRAGGWQSTIGPTLAGATLGMLGLGNLGSQVAQVGRAFGMEVIAWSQNLTRERAEERGARLVTKDELFAQSDVISIHLVLGDRNRNLVTARELALMKPTAYLVNTSRGPIVNETDLIEALTSGRIAGAGLDVFDEEPLPLDHPLRRLPNTVITPHLGYVTTGTYEVFYGDAVADILGYLDGSPLRVVEP
jgi:phosphoglycerate dehydrogenase-like enzyme